MVLCAVSSTVRIVSMTTYGTNARVSDVVRFCPRRVRMAQSKEASEFSPVESFTTILRKLAAEDFASEKLLCHYAIRRQIESLLQSPVELKSLCSALHKELSPLVSSLPSGKGRHQFQVKLWPQFHVFRIREVPRIWRNCQQAVQNMDPVLSQTATLEYALLLLNEKYGGKRQQSMVEDKEERRKTISIEEENAIRYVAGYVVMKMKEMFKSREVMAIHECLLSMEEGTTKEGVNEESSLAYTCSWLQLINRGGLFTVHDDVYTFLELDLCAYPLLKQRLDVGGSSQTKSELVQALKSDEDVLFAWSMVTLDLSNEDSCLLLASVVELWVTIRGLSMASRLVEEYKEALQMTTKGKKSLRKQLFEQEMTKGADL